MNSKKKIGVVTLLCASFALVSTMLHAEDKPAGDNLSQYLQQMQVKLDHTAQHANQPNAEGSSVVGVRGSQPEPPAKQLYWKGKKGKAPVSADEITLYRSGIDQAQAGKKDDAVTTLNSFQQKYPKSALLPDVQETLHRLNAAPAATPAVK